MITRIVAGLVFAAVFIGCVWLGNIATLCLTAFLTVVSAWEMIDAVRALGYTNAKRWPSLAFSLAYLAAATAVGPQYVFALMIGIMMAGMTQRVLSRTETTPDMIASLAPFVYPLNLYAFMGFVLTLPEQIWKTLFISAVVIACLNDCGAYFVGRSIGKHKLSPEISPKKTIEGAVGGIVFGELSAIALYFMQPLWSGTLPVLFFAIAGICCAALGQIGDLSASCFKRLCKIKDFGKIVPGHGGVLDRLDSIVFALPTSYFVYMIMETAGII